MFRRAFNAASRLAYAGIGINRVAGITGVGLVSAAAVAISNNAKPTWSDDELKKRPSWYQETVKRLEHIIKKLSLYGYLEDPLLIDDALDILERVDDLNNCEISWRYGRALVEKSALFRKIMKRERMEHLEKSLIYLEKALSIEPSTGSAGAHKWYAIAMIRLKNLAPSHPHVKKGKNEILSHLEKALKLDPKDALVHHLIGMQHYENGNFDEAVNYFRSSEEQKPNRIIGNMTYWGLVHKKKGQKDEAIAKLKTALAMNVLNRQDRLDRAKARQILELELHQPKESMKVYESY